jgi:hypothetical protein
MIAVRRLEAPAADYPLTEADITDLVRNQNFA